jgi:hypothetical protein
VFVFELELDGGKEEGREEEEEEEEDWRDRNVVFRTDQEVESCSSSIPPNKM